MFSENRAISHDLRAKSHTKTVVSYSFYSYICLRMEKEGKILVVDDNEDVLLALNLLLGPYVEKVKVTTQPSRIEHFMEIFQPDVILLDMNFRRDMISGQEGFEWLEKILTIDPQAVVIFMTAYTDIEKVVNAIKAGATDFVPKPWEKERLLATVSSAVKLKKSRIEVEKLKEQVTMLNENAKDMPVIIGRSPVMQKVFDTIKLMSEVDANVLILGENGTGKDLVARAIHLCSSRRNKQFVDIDLGSIPETLFESELFGYEKGAFTDAKTAKSGRMEAASGGTLFLDEIGNLPYQVQSKLLTAIEKREISRLGSTRKTSIDVRMICATNANLPELVSLGKFRQDLYYRINTILVEIPPLRERGEDVILLAEHFMKYYAKKYRKNVNGLSREAKQKLMRYNWPGNVRELQHVMERTIIFAEGRLLKPDDFMLQPQTGKQMDEHDESLNLEDVERRMVKKAIKKAGGNLTFAAEMLGITRFSLHRKIDKYKI